LSATFSKASSIRADLNRGAGKLVARHAGGSWSPTAFRTRRGPGGRRNGRCRSRQSNINLTSSAATGHGRRTAGTGASFRRGWCIRCSLTLGTSPLFQKRSRPAPDRFGQGIDPTRNSYGCSFKRSTGPFK
jgi:hypothetical protein